jgi:hypothetical protein
MSIRCLHWQQISTFSQFFSGGGSYYSWGSNDCAKCAKCSYLVLIVISLSSTSEGQSQLEVVNHCGVMICHKVSWYLGSSVASCFRFTSISQAFLWRMHVVVVHWISAVKPTQLYQVGYLSWYSIEFTESRCKSRGPSLI